MPLSRLHVFLLVGFLAALACAPKARAFSVSYTASGTDSADGDHLSAYASFTTSGSTLTITLENTGAAALESSDVLTALYFTLNGDPTLVPVSASLTAGSTYDNSGSDLGGRYQYLRSSMPNGAQEGISASALGPFSGKGNFGGTPEPLGSSYGLVNGLAKGNSLASNTLVNNGVTFSLTMPTGYTLTTVSNVGFQYGTTSDCEPMLTGVQSGSVADACSTALAVGLALAGLGILRRKGFGQIEALL
jgi:hypothetical protein